MRTKPRPAPGPGLVRVECARAVHEEGVSIVAGNSVLAGDSVWVVVYGADVHVYPADQEDTARAVYTVGVAGFGDAADIHRLSAQTWNRVKARLAGVQIHNHGGE
jgi:hypothetical protein